MRKHADAHKGGCAVCAMCANSETVENTGLFANASCALKCARSFLRTYRVCVHQKAQGLTKNLTHAKAQSKRAPLPRVSGV